MELKRPQTPGLRGLCERVQDWRAPRHPRYLSEQRWAQDLSDQLLAEVHLWRWRGAFRATIPRRTETYKSAVPGPAGAWTCRGMGWVFPEPWRVELRACRVMIQGDTGPVCSQTEPYSCGVYCVNSTLSQMTFFILPFFRSAFLLTSFPF